MHLEPFSVAVNAQVGVSVDHMVIQSTRGDLVHFGLQGIHGLSFSDAAVSPESFTVSEASSVEMVSEN